MMTGQILGGSPVTEAAHYQILVIYLIATCTFCTIFTNVYIIYRVAFDTNSHVLHTDRFIEVVDKKKQGITERLQSWCEQAKKCGCFRPWKQRPVRQFNETSLQYGSTNSSNSIQILTRQLTADGSNNAVAPLFCIENLTFSVPKSHTKRQRNGKSDTQPSSLPPSLLLSSKTSEHIVQEQTLLQQQRVLCTNLNAILHKGEIGIVRGPSGSGKSCKYRRFFLLALFAMM